MVALEKSCFITKLDILLLEWSWDAYSKEKDEMAWVSIYVSMSTPVSFPNMCVVLRGHNSSSHTGTKPHAQGKTSALMRFLGDVLFTFCP